MDFALNTATERASCAELVLIADAGNFHRGVVARETDQGRADAAHARQHAAQQQQAERADQQAGHSGGNAHPGRERAGLGGKALQAVFGVGDVPLSSP